MRYYTNNRISSQDHSQEQEVVVDMPSLNFGEALLGGLLVVAGIACFVRSAFKNGAIGYAKSEFKALMDLDLITDRRLDDGELTISLDEFVREGGDE